MSLSNLALAATHLPLLAFFLGMVFFRKKPPIPAILTISCGTLSAAASLMLLSMGPQPEPIIQSWVTSGTVDLQFGWLLDGPSLLMGAIVGVVALCVQVYSLGYMSHDESRGRFFALLGLFVWAMQSFVYSANLLQAFVFWELVGLCSFFLIGFWYRKPSAIAAAKKAFIMTRIGDVGLFIGIVLLLFDAGTLDIVTINLPETLVGIERVNLIALLLFTGIVGKSAQFPLHTWLPDAMEGPTPVSALLHSATMVAAGVFLFARLHPLFMSAPPVLDIVVMIAAFTAVLASTMALVATDIKKVLAYSSISQLGYMLMALAAGGYMAGLFHLTTHAFFKALLFLCAGALIHHVGSNDMVTIGRKGGGKLKVLSVGLLVGGSALAGLPPLAGFFSKEAIIHELSASGRTVAMLGALFAAFLTAYYTFRMVFLVIRPNPDSQAEEAPSTLLKTEAHDEHGVPMSMAAPIVVLTILAAVAGFAGSAIADLIGAEAPHLTLGGALPAVLIAFSGAGLAWWEFGRAGAPQVGFIRKAPQLYRLFRNGWYIDPFYRATITAFVMRVARACYLIEREAIDGGSDSLGQATYELGAITASGQTGRLQRYLVIAVVVVAGSTIFLLWGGF